MRVVLFTLLVAGEEAGAQSSLVEDWRWVKYGVAEGLPSAVVHAVARAADGTIWASTELGPAWFDGYRWQPVRDSSGRPLPAMRAGFQVTADDSSVMFAGGEDEWQASSRGTFAHRLPRLSPTAKWTGHPVRIADTIWAAFLENGEQVLARLNDGRWQVVPWPGAPPKGSNDFRLQRGSGGRLLLSVGLSLWELHKGRWAPRPPFTGGEGSVHRFAWQTDDTKERYVVRSSDTRQGVWTSGVVAGAAWSKVAFFEREAPAIFALGPGEAAVAVLDAGDFLHTDGGAWRRLMMPSSIALVTGAVFGPGGNVWFATRSGVILWRRTSTRWTQWRARAASPANRVNGLAIAPDGRVVAATAGGVAFPAKNGTMRIDAGLPDVAFTSVAWDRAGTLWAGSGGGVTGVFERTGTGWRRRIDAPGLDQAGIHRIVHGREGTLWLLGLPVGPGGRGGVWVVTGGRIEAVPLPGNLDGARFYDMVQDSVGTRWFGTDRGVVRELEGVFTIATPPAARETDIAFSLALDNDDHVWVGLRPSGVARVGPDLRVELPAQGTSVPIGQVTIHRAADRRVWATSTDGIWVLAGEQWSELTRAFGLPTPNVWPIVSAGDDVYVGTMGAGVLRLRLAELNAARPRVFPQALRILDGVPTLRWNIATERGVVRSEDMMSRWRLDGGPWSEWSSSAVATPHLRMPWRRHTLSVEARTPIGITSDGAVAIRFAAPPPGWWRRDVLIAAVALLGALGWLTVMLVRRRRLQMILARRVRDAERLELVGSFAAGMAHELNNLLTTISVNAELVEDPPGADAVSPAAEIRRAAMQAAGQLRSVLAYTRDLSLVLGPVDLAEVLRERAEELDALFAEGVTTQWRVPGEPVIVVAEVNALTAILRALAEHARSRLGDTGTFEIGLQSVRLDAARCARLGVEPAARHAELVVADSGSPLNADQARRLFEPAFPTRDKPDSGLVLVEGLVRRFGGAVHVDPAPGPGLVLHVYFVAAELAVASAAIAGGAPFIATARS